MLRWVSTLGLAALATAADVVYVTDLRIYTLLAPCAADALSYQVALQTLTTRCGDDETGLQSCICSNTGVLADVSTGIESDVTESCGSSATADVWSASKVLEQYCDPSATITFSTPTTNIVNAYITELSETQYLAPCAQSGLSYAVLGQSSYCPEDASLYAPCVCSKSGVVDEVSKTLSSAVRESCSNNEDVTSARGFFSEYCAMNKGTTSFAVPDGPPGDMSYYITALPQYKALRSCAQEAVAEAVLEQTAWMCPSGPQALASCVCLKSGLYYDVSSTLTESVKWSCDSTATDDVTSAVSVLKYFCSAAENEVVPEVSETATQSYPAATSAPATGSGPGGQPKETGAGGDGSGDSSGSQDDGEDGKGGSGVSQTATIAASVLGGVVGIALIAGLVFFLRRRNKKKQQQQQGAAVTPAVIDHDNKPELSSIPATSRPGTGRPSPDLTSAHPELPSPVSPYPGHQGGSAHSTLSPHSELQGNLAAGYAMPYGQPPQELASPASGYQPPPHLRGQPVHEFPAAPPGWDGRQGTVWQGGPVPSYELESNQR